MKGVVRGLMMGKAYTEQWILIHLMKGVCCGSLHGAMKRGWERGKFGRSCIWV